MFQLTRLPFELTKDFSIFVYSACPGTSNFVRFSAMFELNHSRINAIPLYFLLTYSMYVHITNVAVRSTIICIDLFHLC